MSALQDLTGLDWIVLVILVASMIGSFVRGFVRELISLSAVVVGLALACWFYPEIGAYFVPYVKTQDIASFCGFVIIFVLTLIAGGILSFVVRNFLRFVDLQWIDRILGLAFGLLRGCLVSSVLFMLLTAFPFQIESVKNAKSAPYLLVGARIISIVTPSSIKTKFLEGYLKVKELWQKEIKEKARNQESVKDPALML